MKVVLAITSALILNGVASNPSSAVAQEDDMTKYTACVLDSAPDRSRQLLTTKIRSEEEKKVANQIFHLNKPCINATDLQTVDIGALRGRLAESLIKGDPTRIKVIELAKPIAVEAPREQDGRILLAAIGDCAAARNPELALRLVLTPRDSYAEREAVEALAPTLKACSPAGLNTGLEVAEVRNNVADALYMRSSRP